MLEYDSGEKAALIEGSLKPDNEFFVKTRVKGNVVEAEAESNSIPSMIHTMDDFLSCLALTEKIMEVLK
jgi:hypothetical protein